MEDEKATKALKKKLETEGLSGEAIDDAIKFKIGSLVNITPEDWERASQFQHFSFTVLTNSHDDNGQRTSEHYIRLVFRRSEDG